MLQCHRCTGGTTFRPLFGDAQDNHMFGSGRVGAPCGGRLPLDSRRRALFSSIGLPRVLGLPAPEPGYPGEVFVSTRAGFGLATVLDRPYQLSAPIALRRSRVVSPQACVRRSVRQRAEPAPAAAGPVIGVLDADVDVAAGRGSSLQWT